MFRNPLSFLSPSAAPPLAAGDLEAGFSGGPPSPTPLHCAKTTCHAITPPKPSRFFLDDLSDDESHHFLDFCFLCKKHLCNNRDIYMYRGDMPFCSVECRQEQIEMDEARERNWKLAMMEKQQQEHKKSANLTKSQRISVRHGTVVPA